MEGTPPVSCSPGAQMLSQLLGHFATYCTKPKLKEMSLNRAHRQKCIQTFTNMITPFRREAADQTVR